MWKHELDKVGQCLKFKYIFFLFVSNPGNVINGFVCGGGGAINQVTESTYFQSN